MDKRFDRVADGLESVQRAILFNGITLSAAVLGGIVSLLGQG
jgi:hypothetical protein